MGCSLGSHWGCCLEATWSLVGLFRLERPFLIFDLHCYRSKWPWVIPPSIPEPKMGCSLGSHWGCCLEATWSLVGLFALEQPSLIFGVTCFRLKWPWVIPPSIPELKMGCSLESHWGCLEATWSLVGLFCLERPFLRAAIPCYRSKCSLSIPPSI